MKFSKMLAALLIPVLCLSVSKAARAEDDALRSQLAKSNLVVVGRIVSEPIASTFARGYPSYNFYFSVTEVLKGKVSKAKRFQVCILRKELAANDKLPFLKKGGGCILFLKPSYNKGKFLVWTNIDTNLGVRQYSTSLSHTIKSTNRNRAS